MIHVLKTWPESFSAIIDGSKKHEVRVNDRDFAVGDVLVLMEWRPASNETLGSYTGRTTAAKVTYVTRGSESRGSEWGIPGDLCVMSLGPIQ